MQILQSHSITKWSAVNVYGIIKENNSLKALAAMNQEKPKKYKIYRDQYGEYYFNFRGAKVYIQLRLA